MNLERENQLLRQKLDETLNKLEGAQLNDSLYFLIGMAQYLPRSSGAGTPIIPPTPIKIICPFCKNEI